MNLDINKIMIDFLKLNHWLNVRKITNSYISKNIKSLSDKINKKKNFNINQKELHFLNQKLLIPTEKIILKEKIPDYIYWTFAKIKKTKRSIKRDGIHFYNYYTLPVPLGYVGPVILDILCPKDKLPKLNNGHLEQAITINLGPSDIYGRWGKKKNKDNFSKIKFNKTSIHPWIVGDTYLEPTYCPHSYSRATTKNSQILSYTAKSPLEKLFKNFNNWKSNSFLNFIKYINSPDIRRSILMFYLSNNGYDFKYISKLFNKKIKSLKQIINDKDLLIKTCRLLKIDTQLFVERKFSDEDSLGKTYFSFKDSFKTIRNFKSYLISSMASSVRYPDLIGNFIKVSKNIKVKDLCYYACSHYLVTSGRIKFHTETKTIKLSKGDALWISSLVDHGFSGKGSLIKISNGENIDTSDLTEITRIYKPLETIKRAFKDKKSWGYE